MGGDKSVPIATLRQAKIYPPGKLRLPQSMICSWIAARLPSNLAAAIHEPQSTRTLGISWIAARGLRLPQSMSLWIAAACRLRQCRKWRWCAAIRALLYGPLKKCISDIDKTVTEPGWIRFHDSVQVFCISLNRNTYGTKYRLSRDKSSGLVKLTK